MRARILLTFTALVSSLLGAIAVYLVLSVPNDLKADLLLRNARKDLAAGRTAKAHEALATIVSQYPRTDAAAAATVALVKIGETEQVRLQRELALLRRDSTAQTIMLTDLRKTVEELKARPIAAPVVAAPKPAAAPVVKKPVTKKAPAKKPAPKRTTRRR